MVFYFVLSSKISEKLPSNRLLNYTPTGANLLMKLVQLSQLPFFPVFPIDVRVYKVYPFLSAFYLGSVEAFGFKFLSYFFPTL
jgi:hypothetical protein